MHGLKISAFLNIKAIFSDSDEDRKATFWPFLAAFLRKQDIDEIQSFEQVKTSIGYCRVFVRKSLNERTMFVYFMNIEEFPRKKYYHDYALLNDDEMLKKVKKSLDGYDVAFNLPLNSSLLNLWDDGTLSLSGLLKTTLKPELPTIGEDVAENFVEIRELNDEEAQLRRISTLNYVKNSMKYSFIFDEDEKFTKALRLAEKNSKYIRQSSEIRFSYKPRESQMSNESESSTSIKLSETRNSTSFDFSVDHRNSASSLLECQNASGSAKEEIAEKSPKFDLMRLNSRDGKTFGTLLGEKEDRKFDFGEICKKIQKTLEAESKKNQVESLETPENIKKPPKEYSEFEYMVTLLCKLNNERGLKVQDFLCHGCKILLDITLSKISVCQFDGFYYCRTCISNEKLQIPSKIIYNWDFRKYSVSKNAAKFLKDQQFLPLIDLSVSKTMFVDL